jgi:hypothetical protein
VPEFLSAAWLSNLQDAARASSVAPDLRLVVQQVVVDTDGREVAYAIRVAEGRVSVDSGRVDDAEVTFTQDRATASEIATGALSAQAAFIDGRLRVGGDLTSLLERARELAAIEDLFAPVRATTAW